MAFFLINPRNVSVPLSAYQSLPTELHQQNVTYLASLNKVNGKANYPKVLCNQSKISKFLISKQKKLTKHLLFDPHNSSQKLPLYILGGTDAFSWQNDCLLCSKPCVEFPVQHEAVHVTSILVLQVGKKIRIKVILSYRFASEDNTQYLRSCHKKQTNYTQLHTYIHTDIYH